MPRFGTFLRGAFGIPKPDRDAIDRVKAAVRATGRFAPDTAIAVNEIACTDPACPGIETVILIMEPGVKTRACKIPKPLDQVAEQDIVDALGD